MKAPVSQRPLRPEDLTKTIRLFYAYVALTIFLIVFAIAGFIAIAAIAFSHDDREALNTSGPLFICLVIYVAVIVTALICLFSVGWATNAWLDKRSRVGALFNGVDILRNPFRLPKEIVKLRRARACVANNDDYEAVKEAFFGEKQAPTLPEPEAQSVDLPITDSSDQPEKTTKPS